MCFLGAYWFVTAVVSRMKNDVVIGMKQAYVVCWSLRKALKWSNSKIPLSIVQVFVKISGEKIMYNTISRLISH